MFRHVVMLTLSDDAPEGQRDTIVEALRGLPAVVPEIRSYTVGLDAGISEGNADIVVVGDFDDADGYRAYAVNADHVEVITTLIKPWAAGRTAVQHEL